MAHVVTRIVDGPLPPLDHSRAAAGDVGSEIVFHGRVRQTEGADERPIAALYYEQYDGMAAGELQKLADETAAKFPLIAFEVLHCVGRVAVGDASLRVTVCSAHRVEGLKALGWFIDEMKQRVPIWKWGETADGERVPS